ncbi:hypothetical protein ACTA71_011360, partial [Dictyostelium dimigraforme]
DKLRIMVSGELSDRQSVREKPILARLKLIIGAGTASMTPPLGPNLGQYGINSIEFFNDFNTETKELFDTGMALRVILWINVMKAFYFELQMPKISNILKEYYKAEFEAGKGGKIYIEKDKLLKDCFRIAILCCTFNKDEKHWETIDQKYLKMKVLEILGTCRSCKIYVKENGRQKVEQITNCFKEGLPICMAQSLGLNGSRYNILRTYALETGIRLIHINGKQVKGIFRKLNPALIINNNMIIMEAPTVESLNNIIDYLAENYSELLMLSVLLPETHEKRAYKHLQMSEFVKYKKEMQMQGIKTQKDALITFTKSLQHKNVMGYPQKKGFCVRVYETKPKKPNSAIRKVAK